MILTKLENKFTEVYVIPLLIKLLKKQKILAISFITSVIRDSEYKSLFFILG